MASGSDISFSENSESDHNWSLGFLSDASNLDTNSASWDPIDLNDSDDYSEASVLEYLSDDSTISHDPEGITPIVDDVSKFH